MIEQVDAAQTAAAKPPRLVAGETIPFLLGVLSLQFFGSWPLSAGPLINGSLVDTLGIPILMVGLIASAELGGVALSLVCGSFFLKRWTSRNIGIFGLMLALAANLLSAIFTDALTLIAARLVAGVGYALAVTAGAAAIATAKRVDKIGSLVTIIVSIVTALCLVPASDITAVFGASGLFLLCAAMSGVAFLFAAFLPLTNTRTDEIAKGNIFTSLRSPVVLASMASLGSSTAVWSFSERIGVSIGLSVPDIGQIIAVTTVAGILGGVAAFMCAGRQLERRMAFVGTLMFGLGCAATALVTAPVGYVCALLMMTFFYVFAQPFLMAIAISEDKSGALVASMLGWTSIAAASVPAVAGLVIENIGISSLAALPLLGTVLALLALSQVNMQRHIVGQT